MNYRKSVVISLYVICILGVSIFSFGWWALSTSNGAAFIARSLLLRYAKSSKVVIGKTDGSILKKLSIHDLLASDIKGLPDKSLLEVEKIEASLASLSPKGLNLNVHNGKLSIPDSDPILFNGSCADGILDFNLYSSSMDVKALAALLIDNELLKTISGSTKDIDVYIEGELLALALRGGLKIERVSRGDFSITDCPVNFDLKIKGMKPFLKLHGEVTFDSGSISGSRTASVNLKKSRILFTGDPKKPSLDLKGASIVGGTKIDISLKGTITKPDLELSSDPPLPKEKLLIMLATNRTWENTELALKEGKMSPDVAKDFIDYFVFSGQGNKMAGYLGVSEVSLKYGKDTKGIGVKKGISSKVDIGYALEQSQADDKSVSTTQKIEGEYKVTDSLAVGAERELKDNGKDSGDGEKLEPNDKVFLKYKKKF